MCGIAGYLNLDGKSVDLASLDAMVLAVAHRGPDGRATFVDGACGLGHRRLSVIDLSEAAAQPMADSTGQFTITYNGEIYNYRELRRDLERAGLRFRTQSDTEVLVNAFAEWGLDALPRLNGMFALAIWDRGDRRLTLARDRYGVKPLYYHVSPAAIHFGSEIKALLADPRVKCEIDREGLVEYLTFQNFFSDRTLFRGMRLLPAGCSMTIDAAAGRVGSPVRFWDFDFRETIVDDEAACVEELDRLFRQAVQRQLVSDVEVGAYLSGGLDSGAITALASSRIPNLKTFTCGFDLSSASGLELAFDERILSERVSSRFKTEHYEMVLKAGDMQRVIPKLVWHLEEPRVGQSYPNYYIAQLASKFVKVALAGSGGDELFAGYPWRYYRAVNSLDFDDYVDRYYGFWQRLLPADSAQAVFAPIWSDVKHVSTRDIFRGVFPDDAAPSSPGDYVNQSLYFEAKTFLHGLLVMEDKLSMAHGLETRVPFLDNDLVDFAQRLPLSLKLANLGAAAAFDENEPGPKATKYYSQTRDGKILLRKLMTRYLPSEIVEGEKQGFSAPDASWFKGDSIEYVRETLLTGRPLLYDYLARPKIEALVSDHLEGRQNRRLLIWSLLNLEQWLKTFLPA